MSSILHKVIPLLALLAVAGCHPSALYLEYRLEEGQGNYIKDVPFFPQERNYCGPASLASVLNYWGYTVNQEDVAQEVFTPRLGGTVTVDMANYVRRKGFNAVSYKGDIENIKTEIDKGHPLILFLHMGISSMIPRRHYIVVVGYDDAKNAIIAYSGREKNLLIPYADLLKSWRRTGYWTLLILPKE